MAKANAAVGICWVNFTDFQCNRGKEASEEKNSYHIDCYFLRCFKYVESIKISTHIEGNAETLKYFHHFLAVEHVLNNINTVIHAIKDKQDPWQTLFEAQLPLFFGKAKAMWWKAIFSKWLVIVVTFSWSFMDLFVIIISVGLTSLFKRLNADLKRVKNQVSLVRPFLSTRLIFFHSIFLFGLEDLN